MIRQFCYFFLSQFDSLRKILFGFVRIIVFFPSFSIYFIFLVNLYFEIKIVHNVEMHIVCAVYRGGKKREKFVHDESPNLGIEVTMHAPTLSHIFSLFSVRFSDPCFFRRFTSLSLHCPATRRPEKLFT